jgi:HTH-type transcriptional regulator/antitoxin MqsA
MPAPETMIHPETGALLRRRKRREVVAYMDLTRVVEVAGWFPEDDGDGVLLGADAAPLDAALAEMKAEYAASVQRLAKQVRKAAGLTQKDASLLLTGSPNSFYKYEHGEAQPSRPTLLLMKLLAREPKLIEAIRAAYNPTLWPERRSLL